MTIATGAHQRNDDVIAWRHMCDARADFLDHTRRLMAKHRREVASQAPLIAITSLWQIAQAAIRTVTSPACGPARPTASMARGFLNSRQTAAFM